jgi:two-component system, chemotaxis family, CheB/CheR fusion protein
VGIVLGGADHGATAGLKEIKAAGSLGIVQEPGSAPFPGMPGSAIAPWITCATRGP